MLATLDRPKTLRESALEQLRAAITLGVLKPGERLVERVLCESLGVSRTVVRECIRHLESERLITSITNAGPSVATLDASEVREIYEIRAMLEAAAVRSCAELGTDTTVERLKHFLDGISESLQRGEIINALSETTHFYKTIFSDGGKAVSWDLVERLNGRISRLRALTLSSGGRASSGPKNLRKIVIAIEKRQPDAAAAACQKHIAEASHIALRALGSPKLHEETIQSA